MQVTGLTGPAPQSYSDTMACCQNSVCCRGCHHHAYLKPPTHPLAVLCSYAADRCLVTTVIPKLNVLKSGPYFISGMTLCVLLCPFEKDWPPAAIDRAQPVLSGLAHSHSWHDLQRPAKLASSCRTTRDPPSFCTCCR